MSDRKEQQQPKVDFRKKGLGWIPDHPDLRDYTLDNEAIHTEGRLKRAEVTGAIEDLAENLIQTLRVLENGAGESGTIPKEFFGTQIDGLENQVFGNIRFVNVKVHKLLREKFEKPESPYTSPIYQYESRLSRQVIALKKYLGILVLNGNLTPLTFSDSEQEQYLRILQERGYFQASQSREDRLSEIQADFKNNIKQVSEWLRREEFDEITKQLVMLFQCHSGTLVDGIVGPQTYAMLNEHFSNSGKFPEYHNENYCGERCKNIILERCIDDQKGSALPKARLVSVPSLIPTRIFERIFKIMKSDVIDCLVQEIIEFKEELEVSLFKEVFFEKKFLADIKLNQSNIFETLLYKDLEETFDIVKIKSLSKEEISNGVQKFLDAGLRARNFLNTTDFIECFHNEFYVVEPIVSVVIKIISPIACFKNQLLEDIVAQGLIDFKELFPQRNYSKKSSISSTEISISNNLEEMAQLALEKALESFSLGIQLILGEEMEEDKRNRSLIFYFLLKKFLNHLNPTLTPTNKIKVDQRDEPREIQNYSNPMSAPANQVEVVQSQTPNIFDKQELLGLEPMPEPKPISLYPPEKTSEQPELFPAITLQLPVSNSFLKAFTKTKLPTDPKPYLYLPGVVDLSFWCSAIEDQGALNSCAAFAGIALLEYFANRSFGKYTDVSPLFLYKAARNLMNVTGDVGSSVRETMKAMALFGIPPEESWSYIEDNVDEEPPPFCYAYAQNYQALKYFRLDYAGMPRDLLLLQIKAMLASGFPCMFGFTIYTSAYEDPNPEMGYIPYPDKKKDRLVGGHAVVAVGYDDYKLIKSADLETYSTGAFLIRNSWGSDWGQEGYGWLPYDYVLAGLTAAWWSLLKSEWFNADNFGLGAGSGEGSGGSSGQRH